MYSILFVDDDLEIILSTRRYIHTFHQDWKVTYANSTAEALEHLKVKKYDALISDIRMTGISGIELLEQVKKQYPHMIRMILSAHPDREASLQVSGLVHQYLFKPCPVEKIVETIQLALSTKQFVQEQRLRDLLG